jgi:exosortase C (VPDSG-CTERM-specific)
MKLETTNSRSELDCVGSAKKAAIRMDPPSSPNGCPKSFRRRLGRLSLFGSILALCYCRQLYLLADFALNSELYSYILLIPFVSAYLIWLKRGKFSKEYTSGRPYVLLSFGAGVALLAGHWLLTRGVSSVRPEEYLPVTTLSFLLFLFAGAFAFLGTRSLRGVCFPLAFLLFIVPLPLGVQHGMERFFQLGSAETAYLLLTLFGMPVFRTGTHFQLPGFSLEVAPQCSGIHSSIVLIITSLLAGYLFLKSPWKRGILAAVVIPLALFRNGVRIFTIAQLCVQIGPQMIESPIHRRGGPVFFVLSLIPLFLLLSYLKKREDREPTAAKD